MDNRKVTLRLLLVFCAMLLFLLLGSCTRKVYVPVENDVYRTDTLYQTQLRVDSIMLRDSVAVYVSGDTVRITRYRDRYRDRLRVDTVYRSLIDSVRVEVPVQVEKELTRWQKARMSLGDIALGVLIVGICAAVLWLIRKFRK